MNSQFLTSNREADIWARLMDAQGHDISPEVAEYLLSFQFGESDRERMNELAERSEAGTLTVEEQAADFATTVVADEFRGRGEACT